MSTADAEYERLSALAATLDARYDAEEDEYQGHKADAAHWTAKMWAAPVLTKARKDAEGKANKAKKAANAALKARNKTGVEKKKTAAAIKKLTNKAIKTERQVNRQESAEDKVELRQDGRTDRTNARQDGKTDRTQVRQDARTDRTGLRQNPDNVKNRADASGEWADATGEGIGDLAGLVAGLYGMGQGEGGLDGLLGGLAKEHGDATGAGAADKIMEKALPYAIGAVLLIGALVFMSGKKK